MGGSLSAEDIKKMITGNSTQQYLGQEGNYSPMLDEVSRLSSYLNQNSAMSNLITGGAGFNGSYQTAAQKAQNAAGQPVDNTKPYGGWGGYGSQNSTLHFNTPGGGGADPYVPSPAPNPTGPSNPPPPGLGTPQPVPTVPVTVSGGPVPITGQGGTSAPAPTNQGMTLTNPATGQPTGANPTSQATDPYGAFGASATTKDYNTTGSMSPAQLAAAQKEYRDQVASQGNKFNGQYPPILDPVIIKLNADLEAKGMAPGTQINGDDVQNSLAQGVPLSTIQTHYETILAAMGPQAFEMGHGQLARLDPELLKNGTQTQATLANAQGIQQGLAPGTATKAAPAATSKAAVGATSNMTYQPDPSVPDPGTGGGGHPGNGFDPILNPAPVTPISPGGGGSGGEIPPTTGGTGGAGGVKPPGNTYDPNLGTEMLPPKKDWGKQPSPPKGAQPGDVWQLPDGSYQALGTSGTYHTVGLNSNGKYYVNAPADYNDLPIDRNTIPWPVQSSVDSHIADPKVPGSGMTPQVGATGVVGYDTAGNPIFNDNGMFEQGDNATGQGDVTPDAYSTAVPWRQDAPTGGTYGAFSDLASGNMTDYENQIGQNYQNMAANPATQDDLNTKALLDKYNSTSGQGVDEAYGAYNGMINNGGYTDAQKAAMEGSAVRGVTAGFQSGADDMRRQAARTGNANSAYAAMASMGSKYGADLGETNRQNQIQFANEAERQKEVGASGMTNVAGLAQAHATTGLTQSEAYANEMQRRKEAATKGMGDYATYGRGLQAQGLAGLTDLNKTANANTNNAYSQIAALLGTQTGQSSSGTANTSQTGWQVHT